MTPSKSIMVTFFVLGVLLLFTSISLVVLTGTPFIAVFGIFMCAQVSFCLGFIFAQRWRVGK